MSSEHIFHVEPASGFWRGYLFLSAITILYLDHFLTFDDEVRFIWKCKNGSRGRYWFFINRYLPFIANPIFVILDQLLPKSSVSFLFQQLMILVIQLVVCHLLAIRVYILYGCDKRILWSIVVPSFVLLGFTGWSVTTDMQNQNIPIGTRLATAWEAELIFDLYILILTLYKSYTDIHKPRDKLKSPSILTTMLLRDGAVYCGVMLAANAVNILTYYLDTKRGLEGTLAPLATTISSTMMSRLIINLRKSTVSSASAVKSDLAFEQDQEQGRNTHIMSGVMDFEFHVPLGMRDDDTEEGDDIGDDIEECARAIESRDAVV